MRLFSSKRVNINVEYVDYIRTPDQNEIMIYTSLIIYILELTTVCCQVSKHVL